MKKSDIVKETINKHSKVSSLQLARKLYAEYPLLFKTEDSARTAIRYYRHASGEKNRQLRSNKKDVTVVPPEKRTYAIAKSQARKRKYHTIPANIKDVVSLSDIHFPKHDSHALQLACEYIDKIQPGAIILNGDILDNTSFTKFRKAPDARAAREMFDMAYEWLKSLRENNPDTLIWWIEGNHDRWYKNWLIDHAAQVWDDPYYQLEARLKLDELNIKYIDEFDIVMCGKLPIVHGHTIIRGVFAPVNSARGGWLKTKHTVLFGHTHQVSRHPEKNLLGKQFVVFSQGCLCTLNPEYDPHNTRHSHGFAHIVKERNGNFIVHNYEIIENELRG